jgi:hypothetical protein
MSTSRRLANTRDQRVYVQPSVHQAGRACVEISVSLRHLCRNNLLLARTLPAGNISAIQFQSQNPETYVYRRLPDPSSQEGRHRSISGSAPSDPIR